jgi:hypothetical protein
MRHLLTRRDVFSKLYTGLGVSRSTPCLMPRRRLRDSTSCQNLALHASREGVILLFQNGGPSQMDLFDPKPELTRRSGEKPGDGFINTVDIKKNRRVDGQPV